MFARRTDDAWLPAGHKSAGHHITVIQSLPLTVEIDKKRVIVLDALRRQRNVNSYSGDDIDESTAEHCIAEAQHLIDDVVSWRASKRPGLI